MAKREVTPEKIAELVTKNPYILLSSLCRKSLFHFVQTFWEYIATTDFVSNWHIPYICNELETIARRVADNKKSLYDLCINIPPGTTKTILTSIMFPAWCWVNWPHFRFICVSYSGTLSIQAAVHCRNIMTSDLYKKLFPEIRLNPDSAAKNLFKIDRQVGYKRWKSEGERFSTSVNGTVTGMHGHIIIIDDPLNPREAASAISIETANQFVTTTLSSRKVDKMDIAEIGRAHV